MKKYLIIALLIFFAACKSNRNGRNNVDMQNSQHITSSTKIFISKNLQDTLLLFLATNDSIPNPWNAPTLYTVICERDHQDTLITFTAHIGFIKRILLDQTASEDTAFYIKGGCEVNGKTVIVYYGNLEKLENIIHEEALSIQFAETFDFSKKYDIEMYDWALRLPSEWRYKLNNNSLLLLSKRKGGFEKKEKDFSLNFK